MVSSNRLQWRVNDQHWYELAQCRIDQMDPELFFSEKNEQANPEALRTCRKCPVRLDCLSSAMLEEHGPAYGVRGGLSGRQREKLRWGKDPAVIRLVTSW